MSNYTSETFTASDPLDQANMSDLPPPNTRRWDSRRKAKVVEAVRSGIISIERATQIYRMSIEEFLSWQLLYDRYGHKGLTVKQALQYRKQY